MFEKDSQAQYFGAMAIENVFITEFLPAAKGEYVKVYLLALYHSQMREENVGVPELAKELDLKPDEVEAALRYWERRGLVSKTSDGAAASYRFHSAVQRMLTGEDLRTSVDERYISFAENVYALFADKRKITPNEIALAYEWVQDAGLSQEAVLMLLNHMALTRGARFSFKSAQKLAAKMQDANVVTCEDAESFLRFEGEIASGTQAVLRRMGQRRLPTEDELSLYKKWRAQWGFEPQAVLSACAAMTAGQSPSFKYLDSILERLYTQGQARTDKQVQDALTTQDDEMKRLREFRDALGSKSPIKSLAPLYDAMAQEFPRAVILLAAGECSRVGAHTMDSLQRLLDAWAQKNIMTEQAAIDYLKRVKEENTTLQRMFDACGHQAKPNVRDRELLSLWRSQGFEEETLLLAASQAFSVEGGKMRYIAKVLASWHAAGATRSEDAKRHVLTPKKETQKPPKTVSAQRYEQREYAKEDLDSVVNMNEFVKEAMKKP